MSIYPIPNPVLTRFWHPNPKRVLYFDPPPPDVFSVSKTSSSPTPPMFTYQSLSHAALLCRLLSSVAACCLSSVACHRLLHLCRRLLRLCSLFCIVEALCSLGYVLDGTVAVSAPKSDRALRSNQTSAAGRVQGRLHGSCWHATPSPGQLDIGQAARSGWTGDNRTRQSER